MRSGKNERWLWLVVLAAASGCATGAPPAVIAEQGSFHLSVAGARYESQTDTNLKAFHAANDYCSALGKQMLFRHSTESGAHSYSPKQEDLLFVCSDPNQPVYLRASAKRDQQVVAQQQ